MIAPGAAVSEGQAVMELETDKAVVEVPSSVSGTVKEILVKEGDKIKVGQVIFTADGNGAAVRRHGRSARDESKRRRRSAPRVRGGSERICRCNGADTTAAAKPQGRSGIQQ